ncbi:MAG: hypothetical protein HYZ53_00970 [Planctomycetes bacterium]|nr:hypothetical protein [Planctomycetota bacterium]
MRRSKWLGLGSAALGFLLSSPLGAQDGFKDLESQDLVRLLNERDRLVSLSFTNAPVRAILQIMAQDAELNLLIPETIKGDLPSIELKRVSFKDAFLSVLRQSGIGARVEGDIISLVPQDALQIATFVVRYKSMEQLVKILTPHLGGGAVGGAAGAGTPSLTKDASSNTLIVKTKAADLDVLRKLIARFDTPDLDGDTERDGVMGLRARYADPKTILASLATASSGPETVAGGLTVDNNSGMILSTGNSVAKQNLKRALPLLDKTIPRVMIEAAVISVKLTDNEKYGVNFQKFAQLGEWATSTTGVLSSLAVDANGGQQQGNVAGRAVDDLGSRGSLIGITDPANITTPGAGLLLSTTQHSITTVLEALQTSVNLQLLSHPRLMALHEKPARLQVGSRIGFLTASTSATTTTQTVSFLDVGTLLSITPHVFPSGDVGMEVTPTISNGQVVNGVPSEDTTTLTTNVIVRDGNTLILGGLIEEKRDASSAGIPILSDLPLIGPVFKQKSLLTSKNEIVIMITPSIVKDETSFTADKNTPFRPEADSTRYLKNRSGQQWVTPNLRDRNYDQNR